MEAPGSLSRWDLTEFHLLKVSGNAPVFLPLLSHFKYKFLNFSTKQEQNNYPHFMFSGGASIIIII